MAVSQVSRVYDVAYPYGVGGDTLLDRIAVDFDSWLTSALIGYAFNRWHIGTSNSQVCGRAVWHPFPDRPARPGANTLPLFSNLCSTFNISTPQAVNAVGGR